ncbi:quinoprotein dehydrogenase-associated SoxYZ-like carrier [Oryzibacter oryziterrae]|uniref:quinoprotein dehydrogenase-associated SoxYZ-like carrier n=1 Tax=Oryzibacter oryziterrae TaxID=2766474 RepID=UPI001F33E129|nr:quinoprotein dehydrogenase-associated SoxYZ-like carrier [Oryzibacter oryziterrae]
MTQAIRLTMAAVLLALTTQLAIAETTTAKDDAWPGLVTDVFQDRKMTADPAIISLEAPYRAEDAAIVPIAINAAPPPGDSRYVARITVLVDNNPSPVAATFEFGPKAGVSHLETRVRVNQYTNIHAVAELSDGTLYVAEKFVKASGGCSAPALKDAAEAAANVGVMKLKQFPPKDGGSTLREAQLMVRHPQNSGMQMDQMSHTYIPPWFIDELAIHQGDDLLLKVTGGISLSEDPNLRFTYIPNGATTFNVTATDTEQKTYKGSWPVQPSGS